MDFETEYRKLNAEQKRAVDTIEGPVMVVAGPGTGKTQILTLRIANILKQTQVNPENILALTFTNAASLEMRERLVSLIGDEGYRVNIFTFHAFCEHVIKRFSFYFPEFERFKVVDDLERVHIIEEILAKHPLKELVAFHDTFANIRDIANAILKIKKEGLSPEEFLARLPAWEKELFADENIYYKVNRGKYKKGEIKAAEKLKIEKRVAKAREVGKVFGYYQEILRERGLYDFHDMILLVLRELEKNENLRSDLQEQYQYILVDEHQDTNDGQNRIVEILSSAPHLEGKPNLFTVGDDKQSIYRFQGASTETFKHFQKLFQDVEIVSLKENYRSTPSILKAAHSLIVADGGTHQEPRANTKEDEKVSCAEFSNYKFELLFLADDISKKIKSGTDPKDIAVIFRSNKVGRDLKAVFAHRQIPYTFYSRNSILADRKISHIITILSAVNNPDNEEALAETFFIDFLNFDPYDSVRLIEHSRREQRKTGLKLFGFMSDAELLGKSGVSNPEPFIEFSKKIKQYKIDSRNLDFADFVKHFLNDVGYIKHMLDSKTSRDDLLKIDKLFDEIKKRQSADRDYGLSKFLKSVDSYKKYNLDIENNAPEIIEGVNIMTAHKSKGLEFQDVYIINATRRSFEGSRGGPSITLPLFDEFSTDVADERRLFYVAMTRAKRHLSILSSKSDFEGREEEKTQFLGEIDPKFIQEIETESFEKKHIDDIRLFVLPHKESRTLWDKEFISSLFFKKGLNVTALNNYLECPKKYLFKNLLQLPDTQTPSLIFGNLIHDSLEAFFRDSAKGEKILPKNHLLDLFKEKIENSHLYGAEYDKQLSRGLEALAAYHDRYAKEWTHLTNQETLVRKKFVLKGGESIMLKGKVDKIEFADPEMVGDISVIDYKTGKPYSAQQKNKKENLDRQLVFYKLLLDGYGGDKFTVKSTILDFIEPNKKGIYERVEKEVSPEDVEDLEQLINDVSEEIRSGKFLDKGCGKNDCEYCQV